MLEEIKWNGNSKEMYNIVISKVPGLFRGKVARKINSYIIENNVSEVTEEMLIEAVKEYAPKSYYESIIGDLEKLRSN